MPGRLVALADPAVLVPAASPDSRPPPTPTAFTPSAAVLASSINGIVPLTALATFIGHLLVVAPTDLSLETVNGEPFILAGAHITLGPGPLVGMTLTAPTPAASVSATPGV